MAIRGGEKGLSKKVCHYDMLILMFKIEKNNKYYQDAIRHESAQWARHEPSRHLDFDENPVLHAYFNEAVDPSGKQDWLRFVAQRFGPFKAGCSLGCGIGKTEEDFVGYGGFESFDFLDVSEGALRKLQSRLQKGRPACKIGIQAVDLNFLEFSEQTYDLILCNSILHHLVNLEHILFQIGKALKQNGILVIRDYVGESQFQWSDEKLNLVNAFRKACGGKEGVLTRESLSDIVEASPFEAIRSQEIPGLVNRFFPEKEIEVRMQGFSFAHLWGQDLSVPEAAEKIRISIEVDRIVSEHELLRPATLFGVYRKPRVIPSVSVEPYKSGELRTMFAQTLFSKRKIRGFFLASGPGALFYNFLRWLKKQARGWAGR
jgi:SAM-dependent methyltransferase